MPPMPPMPPLPHPRNMPRPRPKKGGGGAPPVLPAPAPLLGLLLHLVDPLEEPLGPDHLRAGDPHHVVARVLARGLARPAEVVVVADHALVSVAGDGCLVAPIARDAGVDGVGASLGLPGGLL